MSTILYFLADSVRGANGFLFLGLGACALVPVLAHDRREARR